MALAAIPAEAGGPDCRGHEPKQILAKISSMSLAVNGTSLRSRFEVELCDREDFTRKSDPLIRRRVSMANSLCPRAASRNARWWP